MRLIYFFILLILVVILVVFAIENREPMTLRLLNQSVSGSRALMIAVVYLLGMVSGWMVVGLMRRMIRETTPS